MGKLGNGGSYVLPENCFRQIIGASGAHYKAEAKAAQRISGCRGTFWDAERGCIVTIDLGMVNIRVPSVFRAAPLEDEPLNVLSWEIGFSEEGAAQNIESLQNERSGQEVRVLCNTRTKSHGWD